MYNSVYITCRPATLHRLVHSFKSWSTCSCLRTVCPHAVCARAAAAAAARPGAGARAQEKIKKPFLSSFPAAVWRAACCTTDDRTIPSKTFHGFYEEWARELKTGWCRASWFATYLAMICYLSCTISYWTHTLCSTYYSMLHLTDGTTSYTCMHTIMFCLDWLLL